MVQFYYGEIMVRKMKLEENQPKRTQIMTLQEVGKYLGVHPITIYRLLKKTDIPAFKIGGQWRFKKDVFDLWLMSRMDKRNGIHPEII